MQEKPETKVCKKLVWLCKTREDFLFCETSFQLLLSLRRAILRTVFSRGSKVFLSP